MKALVIKKNLEQVKDNSRVLLINEIGEEIPFDSWIKWNTKTDQYELVISEAPMWRH